MSLWYNFSVCTPSEVLKIVEDSDLSKSSRGIYAALTSKVWVLLIERASESELLEWRQLIEQVRAIMETADKVVYHRLRALIDILSESIHDQAMATEQNEVYNSMLPQLLSNLPPIGNMVTSFRPNTGKFVPLIVNIPTERVSYQLGKDIVIRYK